MSVWWIRFARKTRLGSARVLLCLLRVDYNLLLGYLWLSGSWLGSRFAIEGCSYRYITAVSWLSVRRIEFFALRSYITLLGLRLLHLHHLLRHTA